MGLYLDIDIENMCINASEILVLIRIEVPSIQNQIKIIKFVKFSINNSYYDQLPV